MSLFGVWRKRVKLCIETVCCACSVCRQAYVVLTFEHRHILKLLVINACIGVCNVNSHLTF